MPRDQKRGRIRSGCSTHHVRDIDRSAGAVRDRAPASRELHRGWWARQRGLFAAPLEPPLIIANIGTAVVIFPIVRRQNEELSLDDVTVRPVQPTFILVGILCMLGIVTLRNEVAGPSEGTVAYTLAAIKDWTFLLGRGLGRRLGQRADPR